MAQNTAKNLNRWTHKHDEFCLKNGITPSAKLLWQWLLRQGELTEEIEPDLKDFNKWVARHRGKPYCRNTLKSALNELIECRVIQLAKQFTWHIVRIVTRPLSWLNPKKNLRQHKPIDNSQPQNHCHPETSTSQQQHSNIIENLGILAEEGIEFDESETEVLNRPKEEIHLSLLLFKIRGGFEKILNPEGWIRTCLRKRFWEQSRNYELLVNATGNLTIWDNLLPAFN